MLNDLPWKWARIILLSLRLHPSTAFQTPLLTVSTTVCSMGFLPTVVDIMVIELSLSIPVHFSSLIPKMSMFTLATSCLTTSNLPWFVDLTFQVPMQYCSLWHWSLVLSPITSTTGCCFCFSSISSFFQELFLNPQNIEQLYQRNSLTVKKVVGPTTDFPTWGCGKGTENP